MFEEKLQAVTIYAPNGMIQFTVGASLNIEAQDPPAVQDITLNRITKKIMVRLTNGERFIYNGRRFLFIYTTKD